MTGTLKDYIHYRIEKANESLIDAKVLANNERWNACMSRLYYSCYYIVSALLSANDFHPKTHNGAKSKFFNEFIKTKKIDKTYGKLYSHLFSWRQETDYADFIDFDKNTVEPLIVQVEDFIKSISKLIK